MKNHEEGKSRLFVVFAACLSAAVCLTGCASLRGKGDADLSLWRNGAPAKAALLEYVRAVTEKDSPDYIPQPERIAVFDFDGTLFCETDPTYFDWLLFERRVLDDPSYRPTPEQLAAAKASRSRTAIPGLTHDRERLMLEVYEGMTLEAFESFVRGFMREPHTGFTGLKRGEAYYLPMLEVVHLLLANEFSVYVCSGTDRLVLRPVVRSKLPLPPQWIIGSDSTLLARAQGTDDGLAFTYRTTDELVLGGKSIVKNLQMNKVTVLVREIGIQPVLAFGNSSSDISMLNYTLQKNPHKAMGFMVLCDDLEREYGDAKKAEAMRSACKKNGWVPISMRDDWKTIYSDGVERTRAGGARR